MPRDRRGGPVPPADDRAAVLAALRWYEQEPRGWLWCSTGQIADHLGWSQLRVVDACESLHLDGLVATQRGPDYVTGRGRPRRGPRYWRIFRPEQLELFE